MQAVIIAGGKGTRLQPLTFGAPKPMLPLLGRPFLDWMVDRCRQAGITDILMNIRYQAHQIQDYFGDGHRFGVKIRYVIEETALDTAGAMKLAEPYYTGESLIVFNADILTDLDLPTLMAAHKASGAQATLTLTRVKDPTAFGLVELTAEGSVQAFREKPTAEEAAQLGIDTVNAGTYVLEPGIFAQYPANQPLSFERVVFPNLLQQGQRVKGFIWDGYWMDLGTPAKYVQGQMDMLTGKMPYPLAATATETGPNVWVAQSAIVDPAAKVVGPAFIGEQVRVGADAEIPAGTVVGANSLVNKPLNAGIYGPGTLAV